MSEKSSNTLCKELKKARKLRFTQREAVASRTGISYKLLSKYETNKKIPTGDDIVLLSKLYKAPHLLSLYCEICHVNKVLCNERCRDIAVNIHELRNKFIQMKEKIKELDRILSVV